MLKLNISPTVRLSFGLVMVTLSVILVADLIGVIPKRDVIALEARKKVCEILAVQLSLAMSHSQIDLVETSLEAFVDRNDDVVAASMTKIDGMSIARYGDFSDYVYDHLIEKVESTDDMVVVPVFANTEKWGSVNIEFKSIYSNGFFSFLTDSIVGVLLFVALSGFLGYMLILKKALSVLDPKSVMPDRVRTAFDALSEGVLIIDKKEQIMMANSAFAGKINVKADDLMGAKISAFNWMYANKEQRKSHHKMPWMEAIKEGVKKTDVMLSLSVRGSGVKSFSSNSTPIKDDNGNTQGALITINDVTDIQKEHALLKNAVSAVNILKEKK